MMKVETKSRVLFAVVKIIDWSNVLIYLKYCIWRWLIRWPPALRKCDTNILSIAEYLRLLVLVRCLKKRLYDSTPQTEKTAWWSCTDIIVYRMFSPFHGMCKTWLPISWRKNLLLSYSLQTYFVWNWQSNRSYSYGRYNDGDPNIVYSD